MSLGDYMQEHGIVGIEDIDTRSLVRHIRDTGAQQAILSPAVEDLSALRARAAALPSLEGQDLASRVTCDAAYDWVDGGWTLENGYEAHEPGKYFVVAFDFGLKRNILRGLVEAGASQFPTWVSYNILTGQSDFD